MRLIDADTLKEKKIHSENRHEYIVPVAQIDWEPTVDAEPVKHGHWIFVKRTVLVPTKTIVVKRTLLSPFSPLIDGEWLKIPPSRYYVTKKRKSILKPFCSECRDHGDNEFDATPFCPNCGAIMDGKPVVIIK